MLCLVPATADGLHPTVIPALIGAGMPANVYPCAKADDYFHGLKAAWTADACLLIVEHDVEVNAKILGELIWCTEPWCCFPYDGPALLGCTRFRTDLLGTFPLEQAVDWNRLDQAVHHGLWVRGHRPHLHREPRPVHHHDYAATSSR